MFTIEILSLIVGALESGGSSSGGQQVVLPGVGEVTIPGDAAGSVAGVLPPDSILRAQENKKGAEEEGKGDSETVTSNKGNVYDNTPSSNYSTTSGNPIKGEPNSSVDILDKNGNVVRRRWFDSEGNAMRDLDYTNHGNPKTHPEWPHEHIWEGGRSPYGG